MYVIEFALAKPIICQEAMDFIMVEGRSKDQREKEEIQNDRRYFEENRKEDNCRIQEQEQEEQKSELEAETVRRKYDGRRNAVPTNSNYRNDEQRDRTSRKEVLLAELIRRYTIDVKRRRQRRTKSWGLREVRKLQKGMTMSRKGQYICDR